MSENTQFHNDLLEAGVHFGHLKRKWNPKMLPYIYAEKKGIHIIDLNKTIEHLDKASLALKNIAKSGRKVMFVATKKQAKEIVTNLSKQVQMPYVTERWLGGMLTNFTTIRRSIKKMNQIGKLLEDGTLDNITKKEKLQMSRKKEKLESVLGGISNMNRIPAAIFIVDISTEHLALAEARRLGIVTFGMVDTNSDPTLVDYAIPSNDDSTKSISIVMGHLTKAIEDGLLERSADKSQADEEDEEDFKDSSSGFDLEDEDNKDGGKKGGGKRKRITSDGGSGKGKSAPKKRGPRK